MSKDVIFLSGLQFNSPFCWPDNRAKNEGRSIRHRAADGTLLNTETVRI